MTHPMNPIAQAVTLLVADKDNAQVWGPPGGPVLSDGTIALRVSQLANTSSGTPTQTQVATDAADNQVTAGNVCLLTQSRPMLWDAVASRWQRQRAVSDGADGQSAEGVALLVQSRPMLWSASGDDWNRAREADTDTQGETTRKTGVQVTAKASEWTEVGEPAVAAQATATKAAGGAGTLHVCTGLTVCIATAAAAAGPIKVRLLNGAATVWVGVLSAPAQSTGVIALDGMAIVGGDNQAMVLQFDAAGPAGSQQTVTLHGYSTQ